MGPGEEKEGRGLAGTSEADAEEDQGISLTPFPRESPIPKGASGTVYSSLTRLDLGPAVVIPLWGSWPPTSQRLLAWGGSWLLSAAASSGWLFRIRYISSWFWGAEDSLGISFWSSVRTWRIKTLLAGVGVGQCWGRFGSHPAEQAA